MSSDWHAIGAAPGELRRGGDTVGIRLIRRAHRYPDAPPSRRCAGEPVALGALDGAVAAKTATAFASAW
jgi:hypothetical protein